MDVAPSCDEGSSVDVSKNAIGFTVRLMLSIFRMGADQLGMDWPQIFLYPEKRLR